MIILYIIIPIKINRMKSALKVESFVYISTEERRNDRRSDPLYTNKILKIFDQCINEITDHLPKFAIEFDPFSPIGSNFLKRTSSTTLKSKFVSHSAPHLSSFLFYSIYFFNNFRYSFFK